MARLQGISGGMSGKTGSFVFRQSGGQTIVSQYQPIVKNPNTEAQNGTRLKFKLMSQLGAVLAPAFGSFIIKTKAEGAKGTQRNAFFQANYPNVSLDSSQDPTQATIDMAGLKLTSGTRALGEMTITPFGDITVNVYDSAITHVRIVDVRYQTGVAGNQPYILNISDVEVSNNAATYTTTTNGASTILAYGIIPTSTDATTTLNNLIASTSSNSFEASVNLSTALTSGNYIMTDTIGMNYTFDLS